MLKRDGTDANYANSQEEIKPTAMKRDDEPVIATVNHLLPVIAIVNHLTDP